MRLGTSHHTSYTVECPYCGTKMDGQAQIDGDGMPEAGSVGVCMYCTMVGIFIQVGDGYQLRAPTPAEQIMLTLDERLYAVRRAAARVATEREPGRYDQDQINDLEREKGADDDQPT